LRSKQYRYIEEQFGTASPVERFFDLTLATSENPGVDIYLLGLMISWLWTNRHALDDDDAREPWSGPKELDAMIGSMLDRDPSKRPGIEEVVGVLTRFESSTPR